MYIYVYPVWEVIPLELPKRNQSMKDQTSVYTELWQCVGYQCPSESGPVVHRQEVLSHRSCLVPVIWRTKTSKVDKIVYFLFLCHKVGQDNS